MPPTTPTIELRKWTLRSRVVLLVVGLVSGVVIAQAAVAAYTSRRALNEQLDEKAAAIARSLSNQVRLYVYAGNKSDVTEQLREAVDAYSDLAFVAIVDEAGEAFAYALATGSHLSVGQINAALGSGQPLENTRMARAHIGDLGGGDAYLPGPAPSTAVGERVRDELAGEVPSAPSPAVGPAPEVPGAPGPGHPGPGRTEGAGPDLGALLPPPAPPLLELAPGAGVSAVVVGIDERPTERRQIEAVLISVAMGMLAVLVAWLAATAMFRSIFLRIEHMREVAANMAMGRLGTRIEDAREDELSVVGGSINTIRDRWVNIIEEIRAVTANLGAATTQMSHHASEVSAGSQMQIRVVEDTTQLSAAIVGSSRSTADQIEEMVTTCRQSQVTLQEARAASESVAAEMGRMDRSLDENSGRVSELSSTVQSISVALGELALAIKVSINSASELEGSVQRASGMAGVISGRAANSVKRSEDALTLLREQRNASSAVVASTQQMTQAAVGLRSSMDDVLALAAVIEEVANSTTLLSLNAGIVAAKAGEHGGGFSVIASEIKNLADRTRSSTHDIGEIAARARHQVDVVAGAAHDLSHAVESSRTTSERTTEVLQSVLREMNKVLADVAGIASIMSDSLNRTSVALGAVSRIEDQYQHIVSAVGRQRTAQVRLDEGFLDMSRTIEVVVETGKSQLDAARDLMDLMSRIVAASEALGVLGSEQMARAHQIAQGVEAVRGVALRHGESVDGISTALGELQRRGDALEKAVSAFKL